jgi:parvulin-like peptidyl-prolyl isomerase
MGDEIRRTAETRRPAVLLALGALVGVGLAAAGLSTAASPGRGWLPEASVARVNGERIRLDDYERVLNALAQDKRDPLDDAQRQRVLERLIDEELLVQRALELGITRSDSRVRKDLATAVIDSVVAETGDAQPPDDQLRDFYQQHRDFFAGPGRLRVRQIYCGGRSGEGGPAAQARAQQATRRLRAGEDFAEIRQTLGDPEIVALPDALLPLAKLVDYVGPTAARAAASLDAGQVSEPVRSSTGFHVLQLLDRQADAAPALEEIRAQVVAEYRRQAGEQALRSYLNDLRARAKIELSGKLP